MKCGKMDFEKLKEYRNRNNAFAMELNMEITEISKGYAETKMPCGPGIMNPIGSVHGGCIFTLADITGGAAASSYGEAVTTANADIHYLRPGIKCGILKGVARELKHGKRMMVYQVEILDDNDQVLAECIFTYVPIGKKAYYLDDMLKNHQEKGQGL